MAAVEVPPGGVECSICLDNIVAFDESTVVQLGCLHFFHRNCIDAWFRSASRRTCPNCRAEFSVPAGPEAISPFTFVAAGSLMLVAAYLARLLLI